jgi:hypothetical protein
MKNALHLLVSSAIAASAAAAGPVELEAGALRVEWDAATGALASMRDAGAGREWLAPGGGAPLYTIRFAGATNALSSTNAAAVRVRREEGGVTVESTHAEPAGLVVTCRFRADAASGGLLGRISMRSAAPLRLDEVRFPVATFRLPFGDADADDRILWPECDGTVLMNPSTNRPDRSFRYPGSASLQMMAAYDPKAGVMLAARDAAARTKTFATRRVRGGIEMSVGHITAQSPVTEWDPGYDVVLAALRPCAGLTSVTWEAAADLYREWAVQQPWCRQTMAERVASGDIPRWIAEPTLIVTYSLRGLLADGKPGNRQPLVVDQAERWSRLVGAPVTSLIMSWEKHDTWVTPDYFPPFGGEREFARMTKALHATGGRTMVFLSGLNWTLRKDMAGPDRPRVDVDQQAEFDRRGRASAISDAQGEPVVSGTPDQGVGRSAVICPTTPLAREILFGTSMRCAELGIDCVQVDQIVGGGMKACLHPQHAHPPGGGSWCSEALYGIFEEIRKAGKARDPDFAFAIEEPGEFYLPLLDTYHARDLHQGRWPRSGAGVLGVPLFTHVYHDYLAGYGSEGCYVSDKPSRLALYQMAANLVCGKMPAVALWGRWLEPEKVEATQARLLRAHIDLWRGAAAEYLNFGRRVATPDLAVPAIEMIFTEKDGRTRRPLTFPSVLHGTWTLPGTRTGTVFACIADAPVSFQFGGEKITLEPGEAAFRAAR